MKKTARYVISAALILCMVFALSACGFSTDSPAGVLTRSAMALKDKDSVSLDIKVPVSISFSTSILGQDISMDLPLTLGIDTKINGGNSHSLISVSSTELGKATTESYSEKTDSTLVVYTLPYGEETWYKNEVEIESNAVSLEKLSFKELLALNSELEKMLADASMETSDKFYTITVPAEDIIGNEFISARIYSGMKQAFAQAGNDTISDEDIAKILSLLNGSEIKLKIASDTFYPVSAEISEIAVGGETLSAFIDTDDAILKELVPYLSALDAKLSLRCDISDIGETDAASVTVPDEVREAALESAVLH